MTKLAQIIQWGFALFGILVLGLFAASLAGIVALTNPQAKIKTLSKPSILFLKLEGVITGQSEFVDQLVEYRDNENIKGVLVEIDSPGGVVGPSQEIYSELKKVRELLGKPVIVSCNALAASGGYYAAVAADKIFVNPGTLMGSIGVIMQFANLERLYDWAKMDFFTITTGKYKDSGSPYRPMRDDEKVLFQGMIDEVLAQFKAAVKEGRKMRDDVLNEYADGRIFHGTFAVENGFADQLGTLEDAKKHIGELTGLGEDPEMFEPRKKPEDLMEWLNQNASLLSSTGERAIEKLFPQELVGRPLFLMPGVMGK